MLLLSWAMAAPSLYVREAVAVAGWPTGLLENGIAEVRAPLWRTGKVPFENTMAGAGVQLLASPAFLSIGPRLSFAPLDVFDLNLKAARAFYWRISYGLVSYDELGSKLSSYRDTRTDDYFADGAWVLSAEPTIKLKVWKVIAAGAGTFEYIRFDDLPSTYTYEPYRDMLLEEEDVFIEQQYLLLYEALPGEDGPLLRVGATLRDRKVLGSGDGHTAVGALVAFKATPKPAVPTLIGLALPYVRDRDRVGGVPFLALQARWEVEVPLVPKDGPPAP